MKKKKPKQTEADRRCPRRRMIITIGLDKHSMDYLEALRARYQEIEGSDRVVTRSQTIRNALESTWLNMTTIDFTRKEEEREQHPEGR